MSERTEVPVQQRRWLLVAMLLALAAALVPALFPSGSAMARPHGSAFDPTTSTVTLRVRDESGARIVAQDRDGRERGLAAQLPPALLADPPRKAAHGVHRHFLAVASPSPSAPSLTPRRAGIAGPRAPPVPA